jgi:hypothetical protein
MNALTRTPPLVLPVMTLRPPRHPNAALLGVATAMVLWALLHAALVVSWISAGRF